MGKPTEQEIDTYLLGASVMLGVAVPMATMPKTMPNFGSHAGGVTRYAPSESAVRRFELIGGLLFDYAVNMGWIERPPEGDTELGNWFVPQPYRAAFLKRIWERRPQDNPQKTILTPATIFKNFLAEQKIRKATFLERYYADDKAMQHLIEFDAYELKNSAMRKFVDRYILKQSPSHVVTSNHERLAAYIRAHSKHFAKLPNEALLWITH